MRLIDPIRLKQALAVSAILEDKKTIEQIIDEQPTIEPEYKEIDFVQQHKKLPVNLRLERKTGQWKWSEDNASWCCSVCDWFEEIPDREEES